MFGISPDNYRRLDKAATETNNKRSMQIGPTFAFLLILCISGEKEINTIQKG